MRRRMFLKAAAVVFAAAIGLTGCSNATSTVSGPTRTVTDAEGTEMEVPESPQRVITFSEPTLDAALALGVTPVGTVAGRGQQGVPNYLADRAGDVPIVGSVGQPNLEAIGAAKPDLILVDGTSVNNNEPMVEALRAIAPTYYTGFAGGEWEFNLTHVANALNKETEGQKVKDDYHAAATDVANKLAADYRDKTFSIVRWQGNGASMILKELPAGQVLTDLRMKRPPAQDKEGRGHSEPVANENLAMIDADFIFFGTLGGSSVNNPNAGGSTGVEEAEKAIASAESVPGFTELQAYKESHIIPVDGSLWTSTGGPILMRTIIDDITSNLL